jgi:two-component system sensor kinase FixL
VDYLCSIRSSTSRFQLFRRWALCALCAIVYLAAASGVHGADNGRAKRVLLISTGSRLAPGFIIVDQQVLQALGKVSAPIETYAENLDLVRFSSERYQRIFRDYLAAKYAEFPPDLVILVFVGNLGIAGKVLPELFPGTPIVVAGLTEEEFRPNQLGPLVSGLALRVNPHASLELILRLQPETRRIVVIGGTAEVDRHVLQRVKETAQSFKGRVAIDFWDNQTMAKLRQAVTTLRGGSVILFTRMFRDAAGQAFISSEVGHSIAQLANVPVYVMADANLGTAAVGGSVASVEAFGKRAGELARLILSGADVKSLPFEISTDSVPTFNWPALKRWGIPESRLPPGSVVRLKPQSIWEQYFWYIIAAIGIICVQSAMILDLLLQRARRRRAEAELSESQQFMELAVGAGEIGLWSRGLKQGKVWGNSHLRTLFGFDPNESLKFDDMLARIHPDDRSRIIAQVENAQEAGLPFEGEFRALLPNGRQRWIVARGKDVSENHGVSRMGVVLDITERKQAEIALRESDDRFRTMADTAPVMIWMSGPDKLCTFFNKGWLDFTGRTLEQELGNGWAEGVHREDFDRCLEIYTKAFDARREFTMEYRLRKFDGEYCWVLDHGVPRSESNGAFLGYIGTATNITERKRGEEILEREHAFLRQVIDIDPNFIFAKDYDGRFTLANQAVADAYGTTVENLVGKTDADFNANIEDVEFFRRFDREVIETNKERLIPEERITDAKGRVRWLQTVKRPLVGSNGQVNQVLGSATDITERKRAESELQLQREELAHVTRVSMMGELAASLAHELNQPLTAILSNSQAAQRFLAARPVNLAEVQEILKDIVDDNSRASEIIRRIRALVKKEELAFARLDLVSVIRDVVSLVHSDAILRNVQVQYQAGDEVPPVSGDRIQLQQVILNLFFNAFDAMKDCRVDQRQVSVRVDSAGAGKVEVSVRDSGIGLTSDKLDRIFEPFFTTKKDGLGMGLSISRSIVEAHGGRLWVENNPDRGATFCFTLPTSLVSQHSLTATER